jgi:hypothetical protein
MIQFQTRYTMNVRPAPADLSSRVGRLIKGQKFWSDLQEKPPPGREEWARMLDGLGSPIGWVCIYDSKDRHLDEVAQPAPVIGPTPPTPGPATDVIQEIIDLKKRVGLLERIAGIGQ